MSDIFISHASADKELATALVSFIKEAVGVPEKSIFCSSVDGHGIPLGTDFNKYMKKKIKNPKLVILLITETYLESHFCLMELGAAWAVSLNACPIVVGEVSLSTVTNTIGLKQAWQISDHKRLNDFRKMIVDAKLDLEERGPHAWDDKRQEWNKKLTEILPNLPKGTMASRQELDEARDQISEKDEIISDLEGQLGRASAQIERLKNCKNVSEVEEVTKEFADTSLDDEFKNLIDELKESKPANVWPKVYLHILLDRFDLAGEIDWFSDREEFTQAIQYKLMSKDEGHPVLWGSTKLKKIENALDAVSDFLEDPENSKFVAAKEKQNVPMELSDRAFFEHHLNL
jgi:hypothetical protein